jgi:hypothetical protein
MNIEKQTRADGQQAKDKDSYWLCDPPILDQKDLPFFSHFYC